VIQEMKNNHPKIGLGKFCRLLGVTRQAYYQHFWHQEQYVFEDELIIYLIRNFIPTEPNQLWVSDITYWKIATGFVYISFITDAYSRKIVGSHVAQTMEAVETMEALKIAISSLKKEPDCHFRLTHHSDRGMQYCSDKYVKLLESNNIEISMTENGDPLENAIAERVNGIIKEEYLNDYQIDNIEEAKELLEAVIELYNNERPHMSIGNLTPNLVHQNNMKTEKLWKNYFIKSPIFVNQ
jgi:putative transposase